MTPVDKTALKQQILASLDATRESLMQAQKASQHAATHEESRAESDKDMRSTELSYIARGQAMRVGQLDAERARVATMEIRSYAKTDTVGMSAIVTLEGDGPAKRFFIAAGGAGLELQTPHGAIRVVTLSSGLGQSLIGAGVGDFVTNERSEDELEIIDLA